uniref:Uncharacterized protein n=1 Tax=Brugia malayi TaxID=6279 RepID=A8QAV1_BRUMA
MSESRFCLWAVVGWEMCGCVGKVAGQFNV